MADSAMVRQATERADELAAARRERGGMKPDDLGSQIAGALEHLPAAIAGFEEIMKAIRRIDRERD